MTWKIPLRNSAASQCLTCASSVSDMRVRNIMCDIYFSHTWFLASFSRQGAGVGELVACRTSKWETRNKAFASKPPASNCHAVCILNQQPSHGVEFLSVDCNTPSCICMNPATVWISFWFFQTHFWCTLNKAIPVSWWPRTYLCVQPVPASLCYPGDWIQGLVFASQVISHWAKAQPSMSASDLTLRGQSVLLLLGLPGGVTVTLVISPHFIRKGLYFYLYLWFLSFYKCWKDWL